MAPSASSRQSAESIPRRLPLAHQECCVEKFGPMGIGSNHPSNLQGTACNIGGETRCQDRSERPRCDSLHRCYSTLEGGDCASLHYLIKSRGPTLPLFTHRTTMSAVLRKHNLSDHSFKKGAADLLAELINRHHLPETLLPFYLPVLALLVNVPRSNWCCRFRHRWSERVHCDVG